MVSRNSQISMGTKAATDAAVSSSCAENLLALGAALKAVPFFVLLALLDGLLLFLNQGLQCRYRAVTL